MRVLMMIMLLGGLAGCASAPYHGNFEYFQLQHRHVVSRDLQVPVSVTNPDKPITLAR